MPDFHLDWATASADGTTSLVSGSNTVNVTVATPLNGAGQEFTNGTIAGDSALQAGLVGAATYTNVTFDSAVENVTFDLLDVDAGADWDDQITIVALDAFGAQVPVTFTTSSLQTVSGNVVEGANGGTAIGDTDDGLSTVSVSIAGPIVSLQVIYDNGDSATTSGVVGLGDIDFDFALPEDGAGVVSGTAGDDVIDVAYAGDPEGDMIDNNDAILAGETGNDDIILAGDGNDTVWANDGDDEIYGGAGDDVLKGVAGDDVIYGGDGGDTIVGGEGADTIEGGAGNDYIWGGNAGDVVNGGTEGPDYDTLDLSEQGPLRIVNQTTDADGDSTSGTVEFLDAGGAVTGTLAFQEIENLILPVTTQDGIVSGTTGGDLIDVAYTGDPDGDMIDNSDAILTGEAPNDDIVIAGTGDDTIISGEGSDDVDGGAGDDLIDTSNASPANDYTTFLGVPVDSDPDDDRDSVTGGDGNDTISTGDDADTIYGGTGADSINSGMDDDSVYGGDGDDYIDADMGSDYVEGGDGNDTIIAGFDAFSDYVGDDSTLPNPSAFNPDGTPALSDPNINDGMDTVFGGAGDDVIVTGDDADLIYGGADNDSIDAGIDDDTVHGGTGDDTITGGHGSDDISGGDGNDLINAGGSTLLYPMEPDATDPVTDNDMDYVSGGAGNDTIFGGDDDDTLVGGTGDDVLDGGIDEDSLVGGAGNDTLTTGDGADFASGGDDRDTFLGASAGDVIDGNEGGDDYDTLDLRGSAPSGGTLNVLYDANPENGTVEFVDAGGAVTGSMTFSNIENVIVPCFTPGTVIATPYGERLVENLVEGDRIITRDNGIQEIRWLGSKRLMGQELAQNEHLKPVLVQAGSLGNGVPERDMLVSPNHRLLVSNDKTTLYFEEREVLAAAKHLTAMDGIDVVEAAHTTYIHFMFDQHEVVLSNGAWTESFQPGDQSLRGVGDAQRSEILELFPELQCVEGINAYHSARRSLKKHEAKLLVR